MKGIVIKSTGSFYTILQENGNKVECKIKGKFRLKGIKTTNPITVGDNVEFELQEEGTGLIHSINERQNYIIRKSINLSKQAHIIASNIDQAVLMVTLARPETSTMFIDRFMVAAETSHITVVLVVNKTDIYDHNLNEKLKKLNTIYSNIGYKVIETSAIRKKNLEQFKSVLQNKVSLIAGHSGVGKSTLINAIEPSLNLKVEEISQYHKTGKHTTTYAEMYPLSFGGQIIDTPGIKGFGLIDIKKEVVAHYFPEMRALIQQCRFHNCIHINEPDCAVKKAVEKKDIALSRYKNYIAIFMEDEDEVYRMDDWA